MVLKKSELIDIIQNLKTFQTPKIEYEQYLTDAIASADLLFHIAFELGDLTNNLIVDLGCGTGNLTIAAGLLGAKKIVSVDIDSDALKILEENARTLQLSENICMIQADLKFQDITQEISTIKKNANILGKTVVLSNPPFGVHSKGIDLLFLTRAMEFADVIYSIHLSNEKSRKYLTHEIQKRNGVITERGQLSMIIKHSYKFHKKTQKKIFTDVYRIVTTKNSEKII